MGLSNTQYHYGSVSKVLHWLTALVILALIPTGWIANQMPFEADAQLADKARLFSLHKTLGVTLFGVACIRIGWALTQSKPRLLNPDRPLEHILAETVHWLLSAALLLVPLSGWLSHAASDGVAPIWWPLGQGLPLVPKSEGLSHLFAAIHWVATKVLIIALLLHVAGAMKHHLMDRDVTLRRMLPGQPDVPAMPEQQARRLPRTLAILIWAAALTFGGVLGIAPRENTAPAETLEDLPTEWHVQEGSIELTVVQFGKALRGQFTDWTASIFFDEDGTTAEVGTVTTTIVIPSLAIGSVTQQALGPDFFHADRYATSVYAARIMQAADGYEAVGELTLNGFTHPLLMPLNLAIEGDTAVMRSDFTLDRRTFGIGDNIADEKDLAFAVKVQVRLTATRAP